VTRYRLDPQFHCSYLDSRGVPEKPRGKKRGKLSPFHFRFTTSGDVISGDATSGRACARDHFRHHLTAPPQIRFELCLYTTGLVPVFFLGQMSSHFLQDLVCSCKGKSICSSSCACFEQIMSCTDLCPCYGSDICKNAITKNVTLL
jgi:hypothetical protein